MNPVALLDYLVTALGAAGFHAAKLPELLPVEGVRVVGCVQKRTMNIHRAVCILTLDESAVDPELALQKARECLHKALKARFWRGLGLGVIVYSKDQLFARNLLNVVDKTADRTTILQWVANLSPAVQTLTAAYVWQRISMRHLLNFIDVYTKLNESY
ncbi:MAG TPA: hypothetical protein VF795_12180 [Desulfuromonadaceae bacterium]